MPNCQLQSTLPVCTRTRPATWYPSNNIVLNGRTRVWAVCRPYVVPCCVATLVYRLALCMRCPGVAPPLVWRDGVRVSLGERKW